MGLWQKLYGNLSSGTPIATAVAARELPAELVSIQQHQPGFPPTQIGNSAALAGRTACHFGGKSAKCATEGSPLGRKLRQ